MTRAPLVTRVLAGATACLSVACSDPGAAVSPVAPSTVAGAWSVRRNGGVVEIAYGGGADFPQYAALHTESGYLRMNTGPGSGWGTSVVIVPSFWSGGTYYQGGPTTVTWRTAGDALVIVFTASLATLAVSGQIQLDPPDGSTLMATVAVAAEGSLAIDARPGEAFKPVMLSSMHVSATTWDAQSASVGGEVVQIPETGWIVQPPAVVNALALNGGTSNWKSRAPSIEVQLEQPLQATGWVTRTTDPNADNVGLWAASDTVLRRWQYRLRAWVP